MGSWLLARVDMAVEELGSSLTSDMSLELRREDARERFCALCSPSRPRRSRHWMRAVSFLHLCRMRTPFTT